MSNITKHIKIPYKCLIPLVKDKELLKAFCIYGKLKLCFTYGSIHNIDKRKKEIAGYLGICENTFRKYLGILKQKGLAEEEFGNLILSNKLKLYSILKVDRNFNENKQKYTEKFFSLSKEDLSIDNLRLLALRQKRTQIDFKNKNKVTNILLESFGTIKCPKIKAKLTRGVKKKAENIVEEHNTNIAKRLEDCKFGFIDNNMCTDSISKLIGLKSKMSGSRFMNRLKAQGRITYEERTLKIKEVSVYENLDLMRECSPMYTILKKTIINEIPNYSLWYKGNSCWTFVK